MEEWDPKEGKWHTWGPWASHKHWDTSPELQTHSSLFFNNCYLEIYVHPTPKHEENTCLQLFSKLWKRRWLHYCCPPQAPAMYFREASLCDTMPRADPHLQTMLPDTYSTNTVTTYSPFWSAFVGPLNPQAQGQNKGRNGKPLAKSTAQEDEEQDKIQGLEEVVQN